MKEQKIQTPSIPVMLFLSWFYTGKFPKAPGTFGSLATLPLIFILHYLGINIYGLIGLIVVLTLSAIWVTETVQKKYHLHDPQWIVIDEVIGMLVTWAFVPTIDYAVLFLVFSTFRMYDIIKFWPASYFDRHPHGMGTILDDVVSGIFAGITTYLIQKYI